MNKILTAIIVALTIPSVLNAQSTSPQPNPEEVATIAPAEPSKNAILLETAFNASDTPKIIDLLVDMETSPNIEASLKSAIEAAIITVTKPLPSSNAEGNMRGYKALSTLMPDNSVYAEKARSYTQALTRQRTAVLKKLRRNHNEFDGQIWYEHPNTPKYTNTRKYIEIYLGEKGRQAWLRMRLNYTSDSWLFIKSASANIDGKIVKLPMNKWERDNKHNIWEWSDELLTPELRVIAQRIANSKKTIIRFDGNQYYDDWTVRSSDKSAILEMFQAEKVLKEKLASQ